MLSLRKYEVTIGVFTRITSGIGTSAFPLTFIGDAYWV